MTNKLIRDLDDIIWKKFIAYCKLKGIKVNKELEEILNDHLDKNFQKLLQSLEKVVDKKMSEKSNMETKK